MGRVPFVYKSELIQRKLTPTARSAIVVSVDPVTGTSSLWTGSALTVASSVGVGVGIAVGVGVIRVLEEFAVVGVGVGTTVDPVIDTDATPVVVSTFVDSDSPDANDEASNLTVTGVVVPAFPFMRRTAMVPVPLMGLTVLSAATVMDAVPEETTPDAVIFGANSPLVMLVASSFVESKVMTSLTAVTLLVPVLMATLRVNWESTAALMVLGLKERVVAGAARLRISC